MTPIFCAILLDSTDDAVFEMEFPVGAATGWSASQR
jgi:hypothetical protein